MPCSGPLHCSHIVDVCPLSDPDVGPSVFVCDVCISFHFGLCCRKFVTCLFLCMAYMDASLTHSVHVTSNVIT